MALIWMRNWLKMTVMKIGFIIIAIWRKSNVCSYAIWPNFMAGCWCDRMANFGPRRMWSIRWPTDRRHSTRWSWQSSTTERIIWTKITQFGTTHSCTYHAHKNRYKNLSSHFINNVNFINNNRLKLCCRSMITRLFFTVHNLHTPFTGCQSQCFSFTSIFSEFVKLVHSCAQPTITFDTFLHVNSDVCLS